MNCPECHKHRDYDLCKTCNLCTNCCDCEETPLENVGLQIINLEARVADLEAELAKRPVVYLDCHTLEADLMKTLDFIAGLPHGEAKAAALTVYNLMQAKTKPEWVEITDDPATSPERGILVMIRIEGKEFFGAELDSRWVWCAVRSEYKDLLLQSHVSHDNETKKTTVYDGFRLLKPPTHWRSVE